MPFEIPLVSMLLPAMTMTNCSLATLVSACLVSQSRSYLNPHVTRWNEISLSQFASTLERRVSMGNRVIPNTITTLLHSFGGLRFLVVVLDLQSVVHVKV